MCVLIPIYARVCISNHKRGIRVEYRVRTSKKKITERTIGKEVSDPHHMNQDIQMSFPSVSVAQVVFGMMIDYPY